MASSREQSIIRWEIAVPFLLLVVALDWIKYSYTFGLHNHSMQIPFLHMSHQTELFPQDRFMESMRNYFSYFWVVVAFVTKWVPVEPLFVAGHIVTKLIGYTAIFFLGKKLCPLAWWAPYLAVWMNLSIQSDIGGESLHWFYFAHTTFATALGYWALYFLIDRKWILGFVLSGFIFNIHAMQSAYLGLMAGFMALPALYKREKSAWVALPSFFLAALPGLWWMLSSSSLGSPEDLAELIKAFYPVHFFPSGFEEKEITETWIVVLSFLFVLPFYFKNREGLLLSLAATSILFLWSIGGFILESNPPGSLIKLHVYRSSSYLVTIVLLLWSTVLSYVLLRIRPRFTLPSFLSLMAFVSVAGAWKYIDWDKDLFMHLLWMTTLVFATFPVLIKKWQHADKLLYLPVLFLAIFYGMQLKNQYHGERWYQPMRDDWFDVQKWIEANTPESAIFVTPPDAQGFRIYSKRTTLFEWSDGAAMLWDKEYAPYWKEWYEEAGAEWQDEYNYFIWVRIGSAWLKKGEEEIVNIALEEGADYLVLRKPYNWEKDQGILLNWQGEILYENDLYFVSPVPR